MPRYINTAEAASVIGCSLSQVCKLCQSGTLTARRVEDPTRPLGFAWSILRSSAERYAATTPKLGWKRGRARVKPYI